MNLSGGYIEEISPSSPHRIQDDENIDDLVNEFNQHADIGDAVSHCCRIVITKSIYLGLN